MKNIPINSNEVIRAAIREIALHGYVSKSTGAFRDTERITGYVAKIHSDETDELFGTIDVQEYNLTAATANGESEDPTTKIGYHEGVFLSAIQDIRSGMVTVPKLYSEVTIAVDPESKREFVVMFSHVNLVQIDSHEKVTIGVTEHEEFNTTDENSPDIEELPETGNQSMTTYTKDSVIQKSKTKETESDITLSPTTFGVSIDKNSSSISINKDEITINRGASRIDVTNGKSSMKSGSSTVEVQDGTVYLGSSSGTDDAVLGKELAGILSDMLQLVVSATTLTKIGPQPFMNMSAFAALKARINSMKAGDSGFLTKKVQIQK
jgi:hypothetical protein